jgi:cytochrome c oxidase cbb3-type subunit 3
MSIWLKGLLTLLLMAGAGVAMADNDLSPGASLYRTYCWQCHGMNGDGQGINVRDMSVQPRNHTDAKEMSSRSDAELFKAIKEGGQSISKSVLMPPWGGNLSDEEIKTLVGYLRELCQCRHGN